MTLGQKIKALREEKGLTQSALCGDAITRNMLSRMEHDCALPSFSTLLFLAERLEVSPGYLLEENADLFPFRKNAAIDGLRQKLKEGRCDELLEELAALGDEDEETLLLAALAHLSLGKECFYRGQMASAEKHMKECLIQGGKTPYFQPENADLAHRFLSALQAAQSDRLPEFPPVRSDTLLQAVEYYTYLYMLHLTSTAPYDLSARVYDTLRITNPLYKKHIHARLSMAAHNNSRAADLLWEIVETMDSESNENPDGQPFDPALCLQILSEAESLFRLSGNYEKAYHCLVRHNRLSASFRQ